MSLGDRRYRERYQTDKPIARYFGLLQAIVGAPLIPAANIRCHFSICFEMRLRGRDPASRQPLNEAEHLYLAFHAQVHGVPRGCSCAACLDQQGRHLHHLHASWSKISLQV